MRSVAWRLAGRVCDHSLPRCLKDLLRLITIGPLELLRSDLFRTSLSKKATLGYELISEAEEGLARLSQHPVFLGWGLKDFVFDHHFLSVWQSYFPDAEVVRYPDAGHYVLEDAADDLIPKISDFLSKTI